MLRNALRSANLKDVQAAELRTTRPRTNGLRGCLAAVGALALAVLGGCETTVVEGWQVDVAIAWTDDAATLAAEGIVTESGDTLRFDDIALVTSAVELLPCPESKLTRGLRALIGLHVAHAHLPNSPTQIGTTWVQHLADSVLDYGTLQPPRQDAYCEARYVILAADEDAYGLEEDQTMQGVVVRLRGSYLDGDAGDEATPVQFLLDVPLAFDAPLPLLDDNGAAAPLRGNGGQRHLLTITHDPSQWFAQIDFPGALDQTALYETHIRLAQNVVTSAQATWVRVD